MDASGRYDAKTEDRSVNKYLCLSSIPLSKTSLSLNREGGLDLQMNP